MKIFNRCSLALLLLAPAVRPQVAVEANKQYQTPEGRAQVAKSLSDPHREQQLKPRELVAMLEIQPGSTVIDVGTGIGFMLPYLSEAVGPHGRVIAEDIAADFLEKAKARIQENHLANVSTIHGAERDPKLPQGQADLVFMLDVYHHFNYPAEMLAHIGRALKPGGRLAIADFYKNKRGPQDKDMSHHIRIDRDGVIKELEENGYKLISYQDHSTSTYVLLFQKR
ncbi:MAG TPA: methyltransferase [Bryobacterales bacterium]|nr:methyltransferase [Bryobacterales bacterium]